MKNKLASILIASFLLIVFFSCTKKENKIYFEGGTEPILSASKSGTIPLSYATKDQEAIKLTWTNPDYKFTTGPSSQTVSYQIEIDTTGSNFTNPNKKIISVGSDLSISISQNDFNDYLLNQLQLSTTMAHNVEIRIKSTLINGAVPLYSNVLKFNVTPYAIPPKVAPPASGKLYIVGNATNGDWNNPVPVPSQEFTKVSPTFYTITLPLKGGNFYLFLPVNGDWSAKYGAMGGNGSNNPNGDDFKAGGGDIVAPAASGNYRIDVDFQRGKFTVTKL